MLNVYYNFICNGAAIENKKFELKKKTFSCILHKQDKKLDVKGGVC